MTNLENFPENEAAKKMLSMVSPIYENAYVGKWLFEIMGQMMSVPVNLTMDLEKEVSPNTATWTLPIWENMYHIQTNTALSLEQRRQKILSRRNFKRPMNPARIEQEVTTATGRKTKVIENTAPSTYEICIYPGDSEVFLDKTIELVKNLKQSMKHVDIVFEVPTTVRIRADPEVQGKSYPHVLTGTRPDVNMQGAIGDVEILAETETTSESIVYVPSGTKAAGTVPDVNVPGVTGYPGLNTEIAAVSGIAAYKACGAVGLKKGG